MRLQTVFVMAFVIDFDSLVLCWRSGQSVKLAIRSISSGQIAHFFLGPSFLVQHNLAQV